MIRRTELLRALKKVVSDKAPIAGSTLLLLILGTISCSDSGKCEDYLRNRGLDDSWKGLELAVERNDRLGVDCLMDSGHHPWNPIWYIRGRRILVSAVSRGHSEIVRLFGNAGASVDFEIERGGYQPIHYATSNGNAETLKVLLAAGADPDASGYPPYGEGDAPRPLYDAIISRHTFEGKGDRLEVVRALVEAGAEIDFVDPGTGESPLAAALLDGDIAIAAYLLTKGADPNLRIWDNRRAIHSAIRGNNQRCVKLLLSSDADPNVQADDGITPLVQAIKANNFEIVRILLEHGADPKMPGPEGHLPIDFARTGGMRKLLREAMEGR